MQLRLVILANDGRAARNLEVGPAGIVLAVAGVLAAISCVLWVGWKIGEFTAQF